MPLFLLISFIIGQILGYSIVKISSIVNTITLSELIFQPSEYLISTFIGEKCLKRITDKLAKLKDYQLGIGIGKKHEISNDTFITSLVYVRNILRISISFYFSYKFWLRANLFSQKLRISSLWWTIYILPTNKD